MNIDTLSKMVRDLILDNDKVGLPGLGSFVAEPVPASFSDDGYSIRPPYRKLYFRRNVEPDSLLAEAYSKASGLSVASAEAELREFISEMKFVLNRQKVIIFPELGKLRATQENNYFFVTDNDIDICPEYNRLASVPLKVRKEPGTVIGRYAFETQTAAVAASPSSPEPPVAEEPSEAEPPVAKEPSVAEPPVAEELPVAGTAADTEVQSARDEAIEKETVHRKKKGLGKPVKAAIWTCAAVAAVFAAFVLASRLLPGSTDFLLYGSEDIEILRASGL